MKKFLLALICCIASVAQQAKTPDAGPAALRLSWANNMLRISGPQVPGEYIEVWYLEAFCRSGSTRRQWQETTIPHKTELIASMGNEVHLRTRVQPSVVIEHVITSTADEVLFQDSIRNEGADFVDVQWFQPCVRLARFTGANQTNYIEKSFIFTSDGLQLLSKMPRTEEAIYRGGQVYVPEGIPLADVNPRPISTVKPVNSLIGAFSADSKKIFATAADQTQELFQGVAVCLHNDPRIGGLKPRESRKIRSKIYVIDNNPEELLRRYRNDFSR